MDYAEFLKILAASPPADFIRSWPWAYPILETLHVIGLGLLFGGVFAFDLRLLGIHSDMPLHLLARHILPWVWLGFILNACSGCLLFLSDAVSFGTNTSLKVKLFLIVIAGMNMTWFHWRIFPGSEQWDQGPAIPPAAKRTALLSIFIWLSIITAGRMIAYIP